MRTTRDGDKVFVTNWLEPTKHCPNGRFNGFPENAKSLLAWCEIPIFENSKADASRAATPAVETDSAKRGADTLVPVCPALIDDVGSV